MKEKGLNPDIIAFNVLSGGLSRKGLSHEVLDLLDYMRVQGLEPTTVTHNMIIEGLCIGGKVREAEMFVGSLEDKGLDNYSAMVYGYCEVKETRSAYELFVGLSKQGLLVNREACLRLLSSLCTKSEFDSAFTVFETVLASDQKRMCGKLITSLCHEKKNERSTMGV